VFVWLSLRARDRREGLEEAASGHFKTAEPLLRKALERDPADAEVVAALARGYTKADDVENADAYLSRWIELRPDEAEPRKLRMEYFRKQKRPEDAYPDGVKLLALTPDDAQLRRTVMGLAFSSGDFAKAEELCRASLAAAPDDVGLRQMLAEIRRARGDNAGAAAILDEILRRPSPPTGAMLARALLYEEAGDPEKAVPLLREVLKLDKSRRRTAGTRLAVVLERTGKADEARAVMAEVRRLQDVEVFGEAIKTQPNNLELHVQIAERLLAAGHVPDGLSLLQSVLKTNPTFRPAHLALAAHYEKSGDPARAAEHRKLAGPTP
jgi:tetratricopeptide (TPR) repeat protein